MSRPIIHVAINAEYAPKWAKSSADAFKAWKVLKLHEAGVPIVGGPITPELDYSQGTLDVWDSLVAGEVDYIWKFIEREETKL